MSSKNIRYLVLTAAIAALYALLTLILPLNVAGVQLRVSEALTLLPVLTDAAVPGLALGCVIANFLQGAPLPDVIFGSLATLIAAVLTRRLRKKIYLAALMPALSNGLIVGALLTYVYHALPLYLSVPSVAAGELVICYALGIPMLRALEKTKLLDQ